MGLCSASSSIRNFLKIEFFWIFWICYAGYAGWGSYATAYTKFSSKQGWKMNVFHLKLGHEFLKISKHPPPLPKLILTAPLFAKSKRDMVTNNLNYWVKMNFTFYWFWELWGSFLFFFFFQVYGCWQLVEINILSWWISAGHLRYEQVPLRLCKSNLETDHMWTITNVLLLVFSYWRHF